MQEPLDPLPLDSSSLPPLLDPGAQLAPFTELQLPLEPPSTTRSHTQALQMAHVHSVSWAFLQCWSSP